MPRFISLGLNVIQLVGATGPERPRKPDSGHADTISITIHVYRTQRNVMKPRIQGVLTQWIRGFTASGNRPIVMINSS